MEGRALHNIDAGGGMGLGKWLRAEAPGLAAWRLLEQLEERCRGAAGSSSIAWKLKWTIHLQL